MLIIEFKNAAIGCAMNCFTVYISSPYSMPGVQQHVCDVMGLCGTGMKALGRLYIEQDNSGCFFYNYREIKEYFGSVFDALYWLRDRYTAKGV